MLIAKDEVLRYLGHRKQPVDSELDALIDNTISECERTAKPKTLFAVFDLLADETGAPVLAGSGISLKGTAIKKHLQGCPKCAVLLATLGVEVDAAIRRCQNRNLSKALIFDACATAMIEAVCDRLEEEVKAAAKKDGFYTNFRFSPGYGDLPLELQPKLLALLEAPKKIGLYCSNNNLLMPAKSVTAVIGFLHTDTPANGEKGCRGCSLSDGCEYKREGKSCANQ